MGFFSSLWSGVKSVFKGVMKIFSPILKPLGKILNSGWGKALMLAMSVFTMGASLMAGFSAFTNTAGSFLAKFVAGGKAFIGSLLGQKPSEVGTAATTPVAGGGAAGELAAQAQINPGQFVGDVSGGAAGSGAFGPGPTGDVMRQAVSGPGGPAAGQGAMLPPGGGIAPPSPVAPTAPSVLPGGLDPAGTSTKAMTQMAAKGGFGGGGTQKGNWLSRAAGKAWEFAKSEVGREVIGGMMEGYYQGKRDDAYYAEQRRIDDMWRNPNNPGRRGIEENRQRLENYNAPRGLSGAGSVYASRIARQNISEYQPSVPFTRAPGGGG